MGICVSFGNTDDSEMWEWRIGHCICMSLCVCAGYQIVIQILTLFSL